MSYGFTLIVELVDAPRQCGASVVRSWEKKLHRFPAGVLIPSARVLRAARIFNTEGAKEPEERGHELLYPSEEQLVVDVLFLNQCYLVVEESSLTLGGPHTDTCRSLA